MNPADLLSPIQALVTELGRLISLLTPQTWIPWLAAACLHYVTPAFNALVLTTRDAQRLGLPFISDPTVARFQPICRLVADAGLVASLTWGSLRAIWSTSVAPRYAARIVLPRALLAVILINFSGPLFQAGVDVNDALCQTITHGGPLDWAAGLRVPDLRGSPIDLLVAAGLLFGYLLLAFAYVIRYALLVVLAITTPLAALLFVLPDTQRYARQWFHLLLAALFMQPLQLLVLAVGMSLNAGAIALPGHVFALAGLVIAFQVPAALHRAAGSTADRLRWPRPPLPAAGALQS